MSEETVEVTLKVPKEVIEWFNVATWFKEGNINLEDRLVAELVDLCHAQLEGADQNVLMEKFHLKAVFQKYGLIKE